MSGSEKMSFRIIYAMSYLVLCVQRIKELLFQSGLKVHFKTVPKRKRDVRNAPVNVYVRLFQRFL